jgi:hypothetical protein
MGRRPRVRPAGKAEIEDKRLRNGSLTLDEVRDRNGEDPLPNGAGKEADGLHRDSGPVLLDDVVNPPEPVEPPVDPNATAGCARERTGRSAPANLAKAASKAADGEGARRLLARYLRERRRDRRRAR